MQAMDGLDGLKDLRLQLAPTGVPSGLPAAGLGARERPCGARSRITLRVRLPTISAQELGYKQLSLPQRHERRHESFIWSQKEPEPPNSPNQPSALLCLAQAR